MPNYTNSNSAIHLTKHILDQLYNGSPASISSYLDHDIIWINSDRNQTFYGYYQVLSTLTSRFYVKNCNLLHQQYHVSMIQSNIYVVTGSYSVKASASDHGKPRQQFQLTFVWNIDLTSVQLVHVHIAPVTALSSKPAFRFYGKHSQTYFIASEDILYVEAENINCMIHCTTKIISICQSIGQVEEILPKQFLRFHRSFLVNRQYVTRIFRYGAELSDGTAIPIPEKRYMDVLCCMENWDNL